MSAPPSAACEPAEVSGAAAVPAPAKQKKKRIKPIPQKTIPKAGTDLERLELRLEELIGQRNPNVRLPKAVLRLILDWSVEVVYLMCPSLNRTGYDLCSYQPLSNTYRVYGNRCTEFGAPFVYYNGSLFGFGCNLSNDRRRVYELKLATSHAHDPADERKLAPSNQPTANGFVEIPTKLDLIPRAILPFDVSAFAPAALFGSWMITDPKRKAALLAAERTNSANSAGGGGVGDPNQFAYAYVSALNRPRGHPTTDWYRYDLIRDTVSVIALDDPTRKVNPNPPDQRTDHTLTACANGYVYVIGGEYVSRFGDQRTVLRFDPLTNELVAVAPLIVGRIKHAATTVDSGTRIVVTGGLVRIPSRSPDGTERVEMYTPALDQWTELESMTRARFNHALLCVNGRLMALSDRYGCHPFDVVEQWTQLVDTRPAAAGATAADATVWKKVKNGQLLGAILTAVVSTNELS